MPGGPAREPAEGRPLAWLARGIGLATAIGFSFVGLVSFGALAGIHLDRKLGTSPWLLLAGLFLGVIGAFANMITVVRHFQHRDERLGSAPASETTGTNR